MTTGQRTAAYLVQTGRKRLTPRQWRRMERKFRREVAAERRALAKP